MTLKEETKKMESKISNLRNIINQSKQTKFDNHPLFSGKPPSS